MTFRMRNRVRECKPLPMFEELEQRIVLDASVDSGVSHASYGWDLEYASNPASSVAPMIEAGDLAGYHGTLSVIEWVSDNANGIYRPDEIPENYFVVPGGAGSTGSDAVTIVHQIGGLFQISDDPTPDSKPVVTISAPISGGWSNLMVTPMGSATVTGNGTIENPSSSLSIQGSVGEINATLNTLSGQFPAGYNTGNEWNGVAWVPRTTTLYFSVFDTEAASTTVPNPDNTPDSSEYNGHFVDGANGIPNITAPTKETLNQNVPFAFTGTNQISFTDPDWEDSVMQILYCRIHAENGTVNLKDTSSLNRFTHPDEQTWEIEAYLPWINQTLASLEYTGTKAGQDTLTVTVNDWGNHGGGNGNLLVPTGDGTALTTGPELNVGNPTQTAREATATININVLATAIDNTPIIDMDSTATFNGAGPFPIVWPDSTAIVSANDADQLDVALLVHHGTLTFDPSLPSGVTTVTNTQGPPGDTEVYLRGPQTLLNYSLNNLQYTPYSYAMAAPYDHFTGNDLLTVTVMDNGAHLANRDPVERTTEQTLQIQVNP